MARDERDGEAFVSVIAALAPLRRLRQRDDFRLQSRVARSARLKMICHAISDRNCVH